MAKMTILEQTTTLINDSFEMGMVDPPHSEEELLMVLAAHIETMLERRPEFLMSLLYRLDVLEVKIKPVMHPLAPEPPHIGLARLVLERQKQRSETKRNVVTKPLQDADEWNW
jgi:hypothetical protein